MNSLGIYFGPSIVYLIETKGRKIISKATALRLLTVSGDLEEKVPQEKKIITIINDELEKNKIETREAALAIPGKDLIIRTFELPMIPYEEFEGAVNFEVRKYIPFKAEDLISGFQVSFDKASRTNLVLYIGIKKETLDNYLKIFNKLNIKITNIEYSAFSVLRLLRLAGLEQKETIGVFLVDLAGEDEINFTVLDRRLPVFSRDIVLTSDNKELRGIRETAPESVLEKLKTELRVSLDYYHRKFPDKPPKSFFIFSNQIDRVSLETIIVELGLSAKFIDLKKYIDPSSPHYLSFIKGYSCSLYKSVKTRITTNLLVAAEKKVPKEKNLKTEVIALFKGLKLDFRIALLCIFAISSIYGFGVYRTMPLRQELKGIIDKQIKLEAVAPQSSYEELIALNQNYKKRQDSLDDLIQNQAYLTEILNVLPRVMPEGAWITKVRYREKVRDKTEITLEGNVYLGASDKEFAAVSKIISALQVSPKFNKYFRKVSIISMSSNRYKDRNVTYFVISGSND